MITGSTRLKAGTSQKACLSIISSLIMVEWGLQKMANDKCCCFKQKLKDRKLRIQNELKKLNKDGYVWYFWSIEFIKN